MHGTLQLISKHSLHCRRPSAVEGVVVLVLIIKANQLRLLLNPGVIDCRLEHALAVKLGQVAGVGVRNGAEVLRRTRLVFGRTPLAWGFNLKCRTTPFMPSTAPCNGGRC